MKDFFVWKRRAPWQKKFQKAFIPIDPNYRVRIIKPSNKRTIV